MKTKSSKGGSLKPQIIHGITTGPSYPIYSGHGTNNAAAIIRAKFPRVKTVSDSHQAILVDVTDKDIQSAVPHDHTACAVACAAKRIWKANGAYIGWETSYLIFETHAIRFTTPGTMTREMAAFDRGADFRPGWYRLGGVIPSRRLGRPRGTNTKSNHKKKKRRVGILLGAAMAESASPKKIPPHMTTGARGYQWEDEHLKAAA